jgi:hypothetical protein
LNAAKGKLFQHIHARDGCSVHSDEAHLRWFGNVQHGVMKVIIDWIYSNPTWLWGSILVALSMGLACLGLAIFQRVIHLDIRRAHNDLAGFTVAIISVTYAVLLAFIAIATWESYTSAQEIVDNEAEYVGSIYRDTQGLPNSMGREIRADLRAYINTVICDEWPTQAAGRMPYQGWEPLRRLHSAIATMKPADRGEAVIEAELLKTLNDLYRARSNRITAAAGHIPPVIWWIIFLGGAIVTAYTYLFGFHDFRLHLVMTAAVAASLALVVVLIIALDWPFRGEISASSDPFVEIELSWKDLPFSGSASAPTALSPGCIAEQQRLDQVTPVGK